MTIRRFLILFFFFQTGLACSSSQSPGNANNAYSEFQIQHSPSAIKSTAEFTLQNGIFLLGRVNFPNSIATENKAK